MEKSIFYVFICVLCITLGISNYAYSQDSLLGIYTHTFDGKMEFLELKSDSTFWYCYGCSLKNSLGNSNSWGYWEVNDSLLILNSVPKRFAIDEDYNKNLKLSVINVLPSNFPVAVYAQYNLYIVTAENDTLSFFNQTKWQIRVKKRIKSFYIEDAETGIKSQPYNVLSRKTNIISVSFYKGTVFENENWLIVDDNRIRPKGIDGKLQNYYLIKSAHEYLQSAYRK
jgi:hypothetical protein